MISIDPLARVGFTNDPVETVSWCAWLRLWGDKALYVYPKGTVGGGGWYPDAALRCLRWEVLVA